MLPDVIAGSTAWSHRELPAVTTPGLRWSWRRLLRVMSVMFLIGLIMFVVPAGAAPTPTPTSAAASGGSPICNTSKLPGIIEGFFQVTTGLGVMGLAVVWQIDSLIEIFKPGPDDRQRIKRHKLTAAKSAAIVTLLGPLYTVVGPLMGLPLAPCVNLVPW